MRGFRGSRSAQNAFNSRFGRDDHKNQLPQHGQHGSNVHELHPHAKPVLPDWLKTPETKKREEYEAAHPESVKQSPFAGLQKHLEEKKIEVKNFDVKPVAQSVDRLTEKKAEPARKKTAASARHVGRSAKPRVSPRAKPAAKSGVKKTASKRKAA
jgi:hypothetical protein